ncbi:MAG TPA: ABC transporter permease, partial [Actinomycetota bacterium]|nr:ABC transporter permease [Actinomycetota bacterium]
MARVETEPDVALDGQPAGDAPAGEIVGRSPQQLFWSRFLRDRFAVVGLVFIVLIIALALLAPVIAEHVAHHGPNEIFLFDMTTSAGLPKGPNSAFWFGADNAGRDLFVRVLYGARTSLFIAFVATGVEMVIGVTLGIISG